MARAFRAGVEADRRVKMNFRHRTWRPVRALAALSSRAERTGQGMGSLTPIPSLVRIENEHWVFERIEAETLAMLSHKLILHTDEGEEVLGVTEDLTTALAVARCVAERDERIVLIQAL